MNIALYPGKERMDTEVRRNISRRNGLHPGIALPVVDQMLQALRARDKQVLL